MTVRRWRCCEITRPGRSSPPDKGWTARLIAAFQPYDVNKVRFLSFMAKWNSADSSLNWKETWPAEGNDNETNDHGRALLFVNVVTVVSCLDGGNLVKKNIRNRKREWAKRYIPIRHSFLFHYGLMMQKKCSLGCQMSRVISLFPMSLRLRQKRFGNVMWCFHLEGCPMGAKSGSTGLFDMETRKLLLVIRRQPLQEMRPS